MSYCKILALAAAVWTATAAPAFAYLDPGTGSIVAQAVIGAVAAAGVFWRTWWRRATTLFRRSKSDKSEAVSEPRTNSHTGAP